jgi:glucose-6-phosphate 1-dehydrogenase
VSAIIIEAQPCKVEEPTLPQADPCVVVIFGASGDLTRRKLMPALFHLVREGAMSGFQILGIGRDKLSDEEFRQRMHEGASASGEMGQFSDDEWSHFAERLHYICGELVGGELYHDLDTRLEALAEAGASRNHLFYCATPPTLASAIIAGLGEAGLAKQEKGWVRIIIEKPFGRDLESAQKLNTEIAKVFDEDQVYRIDHYLGKDTVQNILVFRFGNSMFEPIWNRNYVEYVEITAAENLGVGTRAGYYEEAGALRDMVANHLLQLLTLTAMEPPVAFDANSVREEKVQVLRSIQPMTPEEVARRTVRGQYGAGEIDAEPVVAYRDESRVAKKSITETYAAVQFGIGNWRWAGVPFYVRAGKRLARPLTEIAVHLKRTPQALFARTPSDQIEPNVIVLRIHPDEGITVTFGAKRPGVEMHTGTVHMDFCYQSAFGVRSPAAYETLLLDAMQGEATLFTRRDEVEAQWRLITPILEAWGTQTPPDFPNYAAGGEGPELANRMLGRKGHRWRKIDDRTDACGAEGAPGTLGSAS